MSMSCTLGQLCTGTSAARKTPHTPDVALVRSIAAGHKHPMRILLARHNVRVFRFVLRLVGDNSAAEDPVSEMFLDVWRQAGRFQGRSQVTTWLLAIARNKALSALRRRSVLQSQLIIQEE
jgi:RNA polymerase sigma-70 factor, ECF subfamily